MSHEVINPEGNYLSPWMSVVEIHPEGILCDSGDPSEQTEPLDEILGQW